MMTIKIPLRSAVVNEAIAVKNTTLVLRGLKKKETILLNYKITKNDLTDVSYFEKIETGCCLLRLIHIDELKEFLSSGVKNKDVVIATIIDRIIELIEFIPALIEADDKWFGLYLVHLALLIDEYNI